jgi:DNA-binding response OmpR family regulator
MRTTLLVEDHAPMRELYAAALRARGWRVLERPSAVGIVQLLHEEPVDAVVLDWMPPDATSLAALLAIKRDRRLRHVRVILLTAQHASSERQRALAAGAEAFLVKPLPPDELCAVLARSPSLAPPEL